MALSEEILQQIERYRLGDMSESEISEFEAAASTNEEIRQQLQLHDDLDKLLADKDKLEFLETLDSLRDMPVTESRKNNSLIYILLAILLLALIGVANFFLSSEKPDKEEEILVNEPSRENSDQSEVQFDSSSRQKIIPQVPATQVESLPDVDEDTPVAEDPDPIALVDYSINPQLEQMIGSQLRSSDFEVVVTSKQPDSQIANSSDLINFNLAGDVHSSDQDHPDLNLYIFSNNLTAYDNFEYLIKKAIDVDLNNEKATFILSFQAALEPGLYYYVIEDAYSERPYYVDKFAIKLN